MPTEKPGGPGGYVGGRPKDESKLSRKPEQIRRRLRRKGRTFMKDLDMLVDVGAFKPVDEWDLEELARGRPRDKNGKWVGRVPNWITTEITKEAKRRLMAETFGHLASHATTAVKVLVRLMTSTEVDDRGKPIVDPATQLKAAQFVLENILGKPKAVIELEAEAFTRSVLASAIVLDDGLPQDDAVVLDGEFTEEEWEEEDDQAGQ